jgi:hypothetical protein
MQQNAGLQDEEKRIFERSKGSVQHPNIPDTRHSIVIRSRHQS